MGTATKLAPEKNTALVNLEPLYDLLSTVIWTGFIYDEDPVSVVIIAPPESAKTEMLKLFRGTCSLEYFSDVTSKGLLSFHASIKEEKLRHIVILDLVRIMAHPRVTTERTIQTIASLIEDGQMTVADAGGVDWRAKDGDKLPRIGAMMAVTPELYYRKRKMFRDTGFMSRFLPIKYSYSPESASAIHNAIRRGLPKPSPQPIILPKQKLKAVIPANIGKLLENEAAKMGLQEKTWGFRWHRAFRCLAKGSALRRKRMEVNNEDFMRVMEWSRFFNGEVVL